MTRPTPVQFSSPSTVVREVDLSAYSTGRGASIAGIIGIFEKGPIATPTLVTSLAEAQRLFGNYLSAYHGMHGIRQFFENGGSQCYVVRTAHYTDIATASTLTAVKATLTLVDRAGTPLNTLRVDALSHGAWGNGATGGLKVEVANGTIDSATTFKIIVSLNGSTVETFDDLSLTSTSADYVERRINGKSQYITVTDLLSATAAQDNRPAVIAATNLASGSDGLTSLADADFIGNAGALTGLNAFDSVDTLDLIVAPGHTNYAVAAGLVAYAASRGDIFAILEVPTGSSIANAVAFRDQTTPYAGTIFDSSYAGLYYPWIKQLDPVTNYPRFFPPGGAVAGIFARTRQVGAPWFAPAGNQRGILVGVLGLETDVTEMQLPTLDPKDINSVCRRPGIGYVLFGQNTLQRRATSLDRVNVRLLVNYLKRAFKAFGDELLFQPLTVNLRSEFKRLAEPFMARVKDQQGVNEFLVQCDDGNNSSADMDDSRLNADIFFKPTKAAEKITINLNLTDSSVNLTELASNQ